MNVILHVFSNSIAENLLTLAKEKEDLLTILKEREANREYCYVQMEGSSLAEIEDAIRANERNLIAFQFSGHASRSASAPWVPGVTSASRRAVLGAQKGVSGARSGPGYPPCSRHPEVRNRTLLETRNLFLDPYRSGIPRLLRARRRE